MDAKGSIKRVLPKRLHHLYNRLVSRRRIRRRHGIWFELDWKRRATRAGWEEWRAVYDRSWENWTEEDLSADDIRRIASLTADFETVLDAGCGNGFLLSSLNGNVRRFVGVDISRTALRLARERLPRNVTLVQGVLEELPFRNHSFGVVVCAHTLEHVKDLQRAVAELKRVAAHRLIVLVPVQEYLPYTDDYHLNFFACAADLKAAVGAVNARIERYTIPPGVCAYQGDVLLLAADV